MASIRMIAKAKRTPKFSTRRVNRCNIWQAVYTAGAKIPTPITGTTYWHRSLKPKKLVEVRFSSLPASMKMASYIKLHKLPNELNIPTLRPMVEADVPAVTCLLNEYHARQTKVYMEFSEQEVHHFLLPRDKVIYAFVEYQDGILTDGVADLGLQNTRIPGRLKMYVLPLLQQLRTVRRLSEKAPRRSGHPFSG